MRTSRSLATQAPSQASSLTCRSVPGSRLRNRWVARRSASAASTRANVVATHEVTRATVARNLADSMSPNVIAEVSRMSVALRGTSDSTRIGSAGST